MQGFKNDLVKGFPVIVKSVNHNLYWKDKGSPEPLAKLRRHKYTTPYGVYFQHVYKYRSGFCSGEPAYEGSTKIVRIFTNAQGYAIWASGPMYAYHRSTQNYIPLNIDKRRVLHSEEHLNKGIQHDLHLEAAWSLKRSVSDVKFLLSNEDARESLLERFDKKQAWIKFPNDEVREKVIEAYRKAQRERQRISIGSMSGPSTLALGDLIHLGMEVRYCEKDPQTLAGRDKSYLDRMGRHDDPETGVWFRYGAGRKYQGNKGYAAGWWWYA